ncbi:MAG TPA: hypothetical protein VMR50_00370 [Myxococcota bacterium]|nr:hypothetical protein [Myxococcota bacterium]
MLRFAYLVGVLGLAVFYYYFFGAGPTPSEYIEDLEWWRPWGTAMHWPVLMGLAQMARAGLPQALEPILLGWLPPLLVAGVGWRVLRSALGRALLVFLTLLMLVFVYYGLRAEQVWRFFEWRFIAVAASFCAVVTAIAFAATLLDETLRRSRALALVATLAALAGIFLLSTEVTGTNSTMQFNISPWPIITLFGFLLAGATIAALHAASGAALFVSARMPGALGVGLGLFAAAAVSALAGWFIFSSPRALAPLVVLGLVVAGVRLLLGRRAPQSAARAGAIRFATGVVLLVAIMGSATIAGAMQRHARDVTALQVLDALEAYKKDNGGYPDSLDALVPKYLAQVPRPPIGLIRDEDDRFSYSNYGDSYALEFASVLWVQCQYSPPYEFAASDKDAPEDEADTSDSPYETAKPKTPAVAAAPKQPSEEDLALKATLAKHGLNGSWTCPKEPPKLW